MKLAKSSTTKSTNTDLIAVDDNCATLMNILDDGTFIYNIEYQSQSILALRALASIVNINILRELPKIENDVLVAIKDNDRKKFIDDIRTLSSKTKDTRKNAKSTIAKSFKSDITSTFDNSNTSNVASGDSTVTKRVFNVINVDELNSSNINAPILQTSTQTSATTDVSAREASLSLIAAGYDPSSIAIRSNNINGIHSSMMGVNRSESYDSSVHGNTGKILLKTLKNSYLQSADVTPNTHKDLSITKNVPVVSDIKTSWFTNRKTINVQSDIGLDDFYVSFELVNDKGVVLSVINKRINHSELVRKYGTPKKAPRIAIAPSQFFGKNVIELQQTDKVATQVRVFRKSFKQANVLNEGDYEPIADISLKITDGVYKIVDIVNNSSTILYRCIAIGPAGLVGAEFSNAISNPVKTGRTRRSNHNYTAALTAKPTLLGHQISVTQIPHRVVATAVLQRDVTIFEQDYTFLNIDEPIRRTRAGASNLIFDHQSLSDGHVYDYRCMLYFSDGTEVIAAASCMRKYSKLTVGSATVNISNFKLVNEDKNNDVTFNLVSNLNEKSLDTTKKTLEKQNASSLYEKELNSDRSKLQQSIAHLVHRLDLTTGVEESFGTISDSKFSDSIHGAIAGVSKLQQGHKYRYMISTLVRDPETLFESYVKEARDVTTGKAYSFKPNVYMHPLALKKGIITTPESRAVNHPDDEFSHGNLNNAFEIDVTIVADQLKLKDVSVDRLDALTTSVKWKIDGDIKKIDHFIVVKMKYGNSEIVGKAHTQIQGKMFEFIDQLQPDDLGDVQYRVIPVLTDYSRLPSITSNVITIVDRRIK